MKKTKCPGCGTDLDVSLKYEVTNAKLRADNARLKKLNKEALKEIQSQSATDEVRQTNIHSKPIRITKKKGIDNEAVAFLIASDWHVEERVVANTINGVNRFNEKIAKKRAEMFFKNSIKLIEGSTSNTKIKKIVLALLGDFFSNEIHDELMEGNTMLPAEAVMFAQNLIASGIETLLREPKSEIIVPCSVGNHGRMTQKLRISTEAGNSLEYYMYHNLANHFRNNPRVQFKISEGYHNYMTVYGKVIRFHHGHAMRYMGGIGGIYIPVNKAINAWNKIKRADFDVFAHFHQRRDGGNFICNGSLIGYNAYALNIKADYEEPQQAFFLIDRLRGKTVVAPVLLK